MNTNNRIRGRKLQQIRERHKRLNPLCGECLKDGIVKEWDELDHVTPLDHKGEDSDSNRQGLCREHHRQKTLREFGLGDRTPQKVGADGWPL